MRAVALALVACGGTEAPLPNPPPTRVHDASVEIATPADAVIVTTIDAAPPMPEVWLRGSTHVHARPSGDSATPIAEVIAWYRSRNYDFMVLTDHNKVSELDKTSDTTGKITIFEDGFIVFAGIELTTNPGGCLPKHHPSGNCRIHANLLGVTARPKGKVAWWATRAKKLRVDQYAAALVTQKDLGGIVQLNHPNWFWGMSSDELVELTKRGFTHFEVWNAQQKSWNPGTRSHPSTEAMWDAVLSRGLTLWGTASDDAHHYNDTGLYPAGGGWITVKARREPKAILDAIAAGRFYSSTGVVLERAEVEAGELVVEAAASTHGYTIEFVENGMRLPPIKAAKARRDLPANGYVRAVVSRSDGARAWVQPARK